jgi:hypothetical protein
MYVTPRQNAVIHKIRFSSFGRNLSHRVTLFLLFLWILPAFFSGISYSCTVLLISSHICLCVYISFSFHYRNFLLTQFLPLTKQRHTAHWSSVTHSTTFKTSTHFS